MNPSRYNPSRTGTRKDSEIVESHPLVNLPNALIMAIQKGVVSPQEMKGFTSLPAFQLSSTTLICYLFSLHSLQKTPVDFSKTIFQVSRGIFLINQTLILTAEFITHRRWSWNY
jgi:hypothetical protein